MRAVIRKNPNDPEDNPPTPCAKCGKEAIAGEIETVDLDAHGQRLCDECIPEDLFWIIDGYECWNHLLHLAEVSDVTIKKNIVGRRGKITYSVVSKRPDDQVIIATSEALESAVLDAAHQSMALEDDEDDEGEDAAE